MSDENQWYTNKELFEKLTGLKEEFTTLRSEMKETRTLIRNYNGLREEIQDMRETQDELRLKVEGVINASAVKSVTFNNLRSWFGWLFALITLLVLLYNTIQGM